MTTFSTASRASPAAPARRGPSPRKRSRLKTRSAGEECVRECERDHQGQGSAGNGGGLSAPGASAEPRPLARGRCRARRPTPGGCPRFPRPVVARRHAGLRHRAADQCGWPVQRCRRFFRRERTPSRALPAVASLRDGASATLDCALPRQTHWHLSGWTGQTRGRGSVDNQEPATVRRAAQYRTLRDCLAPGSFAKSGPPVRILLIFDPAVTAWRNRRIPASRSRHRARRRRSMHRGRVPSQRSPRARIPSPRHRP